MAAVIEDSGLAARIAPDNEDVWADIARGYAAFSSPMVPSIEDIGIYERVAGRHATDIPRKRLDALMLGVTPGIATMRWPDQSRILAVEISPAVIRALWPGDIPGFREARCASWFNMPVGGDSMDLVIGDGSLNACRHPGGIRALCTAVCDLLRPGGMFAVRAYVRPVVVEPVEAVFAALLGPAGLKVDEFKMRLYLALQRSSREGVVVRDASRVLTTFGVDGRVMRQRLGWADAVVKPFERWATSDAVYSFPSLAELRAVVGDLFEEVSITLPTYPMGDCCPVLVMRSRRLESKQGSV